MAAITLITPQGQRVRTTTEPRRPAVATGHRRCSTATYLRRRLAVALGAIVLVLVMAQAGGALGSSPLAAPGRGAVAASAPASVIVQPGDSLWSVAQRLAPGEDPRPIVDALSEARDGRQLLPGERIEWAG